MSMRSLETKHLIHKGFKEENIKNPFIYYMSEKNAFSLGKADYKSYNNLKVTPMGAAFFIAPFVNAMVRSGTQEEKELLFTSMLNHKAFEEIPSTKRGHALGATEKVVEQAIRVCTNVKNRQTKAQDAGMELLEGRIQSDSMLEHKILLFLLEPGEVNKNIAGLVANKIMAKYQRPVCVLTKVEKVITAFDPRVVTLITDTEGNIIKKQGGEVIINKTYYQGSARGYDASGITNFKDICAAGPGCIFAEGHQGAFGLGLEAESIKDFLEYTDKELFSMSSEPVYTLDFLVDEKDLDPDMIFAIAAMNDYWGKDLERALIGVKCKINKSNFVVMKSNTLKFNFSNSVSAIKFSGTEDEIDRFNTEGYIEVLLICKCNINEWNGFSSAQLMVEDYDIIDTAKYMF